MKKTVLLSIVMVLALSMAITGSIAYLSDTDSDVNVMTLGNVKIEQIELQRAEGVEHTGLLNDGDLVPFVKGQPLYPAYPVAGSTNPYTAEAKDLLYWGPYVTAESDGTENGAGNGLWSDDKLVGALDKFVFVKNTGKSDCYYRTWLAFECPEGMEYSEGYDKEFMMNVNGNDRFDWVEHDYCTIEGVRYLVMSATYKNVLAAGEISRPSLLQVVMTHNSTNEDMELLGDTYEILAFSQAVQTNNFEEAGATVALNAAFGTGHPWQNEDGSEYDHPGLPSAVVSSKEELAAALAKGGTVVLDSNIVLEDAVSLTKPVTIELNGNTLTVSQLEAAADVKISDGTLEHGESDYPAVSVKGGSLTMDNVAIKNDNKPCNVMTSGERKAVESVALQIFEGDCVLNNCTIYISHSEKVYASNVVGISVHDGSVTMNGGSITVESAGAHNARYFNDAALCAASDAENTFTLNNVTFSVGEAYNLYIFGETSADSVVVNTTDAAGSWDGKVFGNATINYK